MPYFDCTSTYGLSVADGFFTLSGVTAAVSTLTQSEQEYAAKNGGAKRNQAVITDFLLAGVFAASAVYGVVQTSRCDQAKEALKARILGPMLRPPMRQWPPPMALPAPPGSLPPGALAPPPAPPAVAPPTPPALAPPAPAEAPPSPVAPAP
jgi:hypothetical protein